MTEPMPPDPALAAGASRPDPPPAIAPDDAALFAVIDRLAAILDHSDLIELEVQVGHTGLTLRKPAALAQAIAVAGAPGGAGGSPGGASRRPRGA